MTNAETYERVIAYLDQNGAQYRLIDHPPEGRTDIVSPMRGHPVSAAAKCLILMVKVGRKVTKYVLGVVPGDARIDLNAVKRLKNGTFVSLSTSQAAEELSGSAVGTILPFAFDPRLELMADPGLLESPELFFNAARLDRSIALKTGDYVRLAKPRFERIVMPKSS
jgi:Ala-tRNA(Pro) deacylase